MADLTPIVGEVKAQPLNDNLSALNSELAHVDSQLADIDTQINQLSINLNAYASYVQNGDWAFALHAAENDLPESGGEIIIPYTIQIKTPVIFTKQIGLIGQGAGRGLADNVKGKSTIFKMGNFDAITFRGHSSYCEDVQVEGQGYDGDGFIVQAGRVKLRNVSATNHGRDGIRIGHNSDGYNCNLWVVENCYSIGNKRHGIYIHSPNELTGHQDANAGILTGGDYRSNVGDGICVERANNNAFYTPVCQTNVGAQIRLKSRAKGNYIFKPYTEHAVSSANDIIFEEGSEFNYGFGFRQGLASSGYVDNGTKNTVVSYNTRGDLCYLNGISFAHFNVNRPGISGYWDFKIQDSKDLKVTLEGTGTTSAAIDLWKLKINGGSRIEGFLHKDTPLSNPTIPGEGSFTVTTSLVGAKSTDSLRVSPQGKIPFGITWIPYINENDVVYIEFHNSTSSAIKLEVRWHIELYKY